MTNTTVHMVFRQALSIICILLLLPAGAFMVAQEQPPPPEQAPPEQAGPPAQALSPDQLANLVAPIALYPDSLLSQVLVAATYPLEIVEAGAVAAAESQPPRGTTGGGCAPAKLGCQYPGPGGLPGCTHPVELRHSLDYRSRERISGSTGRRNECRAASASPG